MFFDNIEANIGFKNLKPGLKFERKLLETRTKVPKHSSPSFFFFLGFQIWKTFPLHEPQLLIISKNPASAEILNKLRQAFKNLRLFLQLSLNFNRLELSNKGDDLWGKNWTVFYDSWSQLSSSLFFHRCRRPLISPLFRSKAQIPSLPTKSSIFGR